jgi:large subunit ribosomal protein L35
MPKIKTHKGAQDRFKITGTGKLRRRKIGLSHLRLHKTKRTRRLYHGTLPVSPGYTKRMKTLLSSAAA